MSRIIWRIGVHPLVRGEARPKGNTPARHTEAGTPMNKRRVFLSDLHLDSIRNPRFARFQECLGVESRWAEEMFILGDLFEIWVGDDDDSELAERACATLREAAARTRVLVMVGNRDFLCGAAFAARTEVELIDDPFRTGDGQVLTHGDALCTADTAYAAFRATVRTPAWREQMLARPLEERRRIGAELRTASIADSANKPENIMDITPGAATQMAADHGVTTLIHGHTHRPGVHRNNILTRYVLGDWAHCGWLLRQWDDRFALECFSLSVPYETVSGHKSAKPKAIAPKGGPPVSIPRES